MSFIRCAASYFLAITHREPRETWYDRQLKAHEDNPNFTHPDDVNGWRYE